MVVDLIPGPTPRQCQGMSSEEYSQKYTAPHEKLLLWLGTIGIKKLVFVSSGGTVYGQLGEKRPSREEDVLAPISLYGESKVALEKVVGKIPQGVSLRPSNIFPIDPNYPKPMGVVGAYLKLAREGKPLQVFGDLDITKDYVSDRDVARAILLALRSAHSGVYNIGLGQPIGLGEIISAFERASGHPLEKNFQDVFSNDVTWFCLDTTKARRDLGFEAKDHVLKWISELRI